jgi:ribosomal protein S18 acetylase RimI-like enzyme
MDRAGDLAECYSQQISNLPYCYPVSSDDFAWNIQRELHHFYGPPSEDLHSERFIVWNERGQVLGFVHVAVARKKGESPSERGIIKFICYKPGNRAIGQALLGETESYFREKKLQMIAAFPKRHIYHFCSPDGGYSELHGHINALLSMNGYTISERIVNMSWTDFAVSEPDLPDDSIRVKVAFPTEIGELPNIMIETYSSSATPNEGPLGECYSYSMGYLQRSEYAQDQIFINWLGVRRDFRGKGWGRYLLLRTLWEARKIGYKP